MRRWFIASFFAALAALPLAALYAFYYVLFTTGGIRLVARVLPDYIRGARVTLVGVSGTVASGVHIARLEIEQEHVRLNFEDVSGRIALGSLLLQRLHVPRAVIGRLAIEVIPVHSHPHARAAPRWHFVPHWLSIRADDVRIAAGTLIVPDGKRFDATDLELSGLVGSHTVRIARATMRMGIVQLSAHGVLRSGDPLGISAEVRTTIRPPREPAWILTASGSGDLDALAATVRFDAPLRAQVEGHLFDLTGRWYGFGRARIDDFDLRAWHIGAIGPVSGSLELRGSERGFVATGPLTPTALGLGAFDVLYDGSYADETFTARRAELVQRTSGARLSARGTIAIAPHGPRLELAGDWRNVRWPLTAVAAAIRSPSGRYELDGVWPYRLHLVGELDAARAPPLAIDASGELSSKEFAVRAASVRTLGGTVSVAGRIAWSPRIAWSASGTALDIDPVAVRPDLPGQLTFGFAASGSGFDHRADLALAVSNLTGELRGFAARATGSIERHESVWTVRNVSAQLGRTALSLDGTVDDRLDLSFDLAASDLGLIDPQASGRLRASGMVHGTLAAPAIEAVASGTAIRYRKLSLGSFDARVAFDPKRDRPVQVSVRARALAYGKRSIDRLTFELAGPASGERASLAIAAPGFTLVSRAAGALVDGTWRGSLQRLAVASADAQLSLESPSALSVAHDAVRVERLCLAGTPARLCADGSWTPQRWSVSAVASALPLGLLTAGRTSDVDLRGVLGITATLFGRSGEPVEGSIAATLAGGALVRRTSGNRRITLRLGSGKLDVRAAPTAVTGELDLDAGAAGSLQARVVGERAGMSWRNMPLKGSLVATAPVADWVRLYAGQIDRAAGHANADVVVGGTLTAPLLSGLLRLDGGELDWYQYNLEVRGASAEAHLLQNGLDFSGEARVGAGTAAVRGRLQWRGGAPYGHLALTGANLRVVDLPEAEIDASPALDFAIDGARTRVTGTVTIPHAHIAPTDLANAVQVSEDQVLVGEHAEAPAARSNVATQIRIVLGSGVSIETTGLRGNLAGTVLVQSGPTQITRASGELRIVGGQYSAYGRTLDIDSGRLIYTASPLDDPGIDIRAVKRFHDPNVGATVAGINVRGTLRQPQITFFSEPPLAQQQIMSLVFAGGTLFGGPQLGPTGTTATSKNENAQLLGQGAAVLGSQIGLPVGIEPTYNNDTALVLGKYLSPRLYVSYGITLIQSLNIVKLRYTLGDHWSLSTEFGQIGGADIVYTFQK
ncbi:MAG TPA: translocation/assembly module TamB domain-containing protein [Steroidobacteraceae bacterium]|nr:translocation/assembly module TamB domain-containing protein [Steroidobacteraceae bacterium]